MPKALGTRVAGRYLNRKARVVTREGHGGCVRRNRVVPGYKRNAVRAVMLEGENPPRSAMVTEGTIVLKPKK